MAIVCDYKHEIHTLADARLTLSMPFIHTEFCFQHSVEAVRWAKERMLLSHDRATLQIIRED